MISVCQLLLLWTMKLIRNGIISKRKVTFAMTFEMNIQKFIKPEAIEFAATVAAIVVGTLQFALRAWQENDTSTKLRNAAATVLRVADSLIQILQDNVAPVPVTKPSRRG